MKKIYCIALAICALCLYSCDSKGKLAQQIAGAWASAPEKFSDTAAMTATIIETYTFTLAEGEDPTSGSLDITSLISSMSQMGETGGFIEPLSLSASASVSIHGTWTAVDDDELSVSLDMNSLNVKVDPAAVVVTTDVLNDKDTPQVETMKSALCDRITAQLKQQMMSRYGELNQLDDVKVKDNVLKFEVGKKDYILTRQGTAR